MKREECYDMMLDKRVYDLIVERFGNEATSNLTAKIVDEIRVDAFSMMSDAVEKFGAVKGLFEESVDYAYRLRFMF